MSPLLPASTSIRFTAAGSSGFPTRARPTRCARPLCASRAGSDSRAALRPVRWYRQVSDAGKSAAAIDSAVAIDFGCGTETVVRQSRRTHRTSGMGENVMSTAVITKARPAAAKPWYRILYVQVLIAIVLGALFGWLEPTIATNDWIKALGDGFIKLIKMVIAPIIFCTVVSGIAHIQDARKVGRIGVKALIYFEVVSTFALVIALLVGNVARPGAGFGGAA